MTFHPFLFSSYMLIRFAIKPVIASDITVDVINSNAYQTHLAAMEASLNLTTLNEDGDTQHYQKVA